MHRLVLNVVALAWVDGAFADSAGVTVTGELACPAMRAVVSNRRDWGEVRLRLSRMLPCTSC